MSSVDLAGDREPDTARFGDNGVWVEAVIRGDNMSLLETLGRAYR